MVLRKKITLGGVAVFIALQFIQPARNQSGQVPPTDISRTGAIPANVRAMPANVRTILQNACYDCHSNNTRYPWYSYIQPVGWWLNSHIQEGKDNLNFSDFGSYSPRKQRTKFREIATSIDEGSMPPSSYTLFHRQARLTTADRKTLIQWAQTLSK